MQRRGATFENAARASNWTKDREMDKQIQSRRVLCPTITKTGVQWKKLWEADYREGETIETFSCNITQAAL